MTPESAEAEFTRLAARYRPIFAEIAVGEAERERVGIAPRAQLQTLIDAGFAGVRIPRDLGGEGARLSTVLRLISELAEADVNLAHIWRNHVSFIEDRLSDREDPRSDAWLARLGRGEIVGGGWSEPGVTDAAPVTTRLTPAEGGWQLSGVKYYATGSIYADWATVLALTPDETKVVALVDTSSPGVRIGDDWDGFGQRLTGSGSVSYDAVLVPTENVFVYEDRYDYQNQFYQSTLNALLVGITRAVLRDGTAALRARPRSHANATTPVPVEDPELLEVIGRVAADVYAAESAFLRSLAALDADITRSNHGSATASPGSLDSTGPLDADVAAGPAPDAETDAWQSSLLATAHTQLVVTELALDAATRVFDALGASGTSAKYALDRHWRNARTLSSHNPRVYVARIAGQAAVTGSLS